MIVVSDTSPITNLIKIGRLELLRQVFSEIIITEGVYDELIQINGRRALIDEASWIIIKEVQNKELVKDFLKLLDPGESESVALAIEIRADYLLIDEKKGRKIAREYGLNITGLLGILKRAKTKKYIKKVQPILEELIIKGGFRIHPTLYQEILKDVGE